MRVGGSVVGVAGLQLTLDDRTGQAGVRLPGDARALAAVLRRGEVINVTGRVVVPPRGRPAVLARTAADVGRVGHLGESAVAVAGRTQVDPERLRPAARIRSSEADAMGPVSPLLAALAAAAAVASGVVIGVQQALRRRRGEQIAS